MYACIKRGTYFFPAYSIGKWTQETCSSMLGTLSSRMEGPSEGNKLEVYTDGNDDYTFTLPLHFETRLMDYGQLVKIKEHSTLVRKEKRVIYGNPNLDDIETTDIENSNGIFRERLGRLVRKTKCFSKKKSKLRNALLELRQQIPEDGFSCDAGRYRRPCVNMA
ncbi:MAG: hypothetical protein QXQ46_03620 [Thermoplasmatales archaeon]